MKQGSEKGGEVQLLTKAPHQLRPSTVRQRMRVAGIERWCSITTRCPFSLDRKGDSYQTG